MNIEKETFAERLKLSSNSVLISLRNFLKRYSKRTEFFFGVLIGLFVNVLTNNPDRSVEDAFSFLVNPKLFIFWVTWFLLMIIILLTVGLFTVEKFVKKIPFSFLLSRLYNNAVHEDIRDYAKGRIAWEKSITITNCVDLNEPWNLNEIVFNYTDDYHKFSKETEEKYLEFKIKNFPEGKQDDDRIMLIQVPHTSTHQRKLILNLIKTKYSKVLFANEIFLNNLDIYVPMFLTSDAIDLPHTFYLAIFVYAKDGSILRQQISPKAKFDPQKWALSIGNQLDREDINDQQDNETKMKRWVKHSLEDELGLTADNDYYFDNVKCSAVHLDTHNGNVGLSVQVKLEITTNELNAYISLPKKDPAFFNWNYINVEDLAKELVAPSPEYPYPDNMGLRMLYGGFRLKGINDFHELLQKYNLE